MGTFIPHFEFREAGWLAMVVTVIGTTISPYMQFFLQSQVVEKGSRTEDLTFTRIDVINGSILAIALAGFMIIANAATIFIANEHGAHINPQTAMDFARALKPLAGDAAALIFAIGILNAGLFTATVLPLSTSYIICEALGFEAAIDRRFSEAPAFFVLVRSGTAAGRRVRPHSGPTAAATHSFRPVAARHLAAGRACAHADNHQPQVGHGFAHE